MITFKTANYLKLLQLNIIAQILSTSSIAKSAYKGNVNTLLLIYLATGVSSKSYFPWKQSKLFVKG